MTVSIGDIKNLGRSMLEFKRYHGFKWSNLADILQTNETTLRKYANGQAVSAGYYKVLEPKFSEFKEKKDIEFSVNINLPMDSMTRAIVRASNLRASAC